MSVESRLNDVIDQAIANETITGTVVMLSKNGKRIFQRAAGYADREAGKPVAEDTIFRLASVTKPIVAATALAMIEEGKWSLHDRIVEYLPWFKPKTENGEDAVITIRHLLTHTSGLTYNAALEKLPPEKAVTLGLLDTDLDHEENFSRLNDVPLAFAPGEKWSYSVGLDIIGAAIAKIFGGTLEDAVRHYVTGPLGMADTGFYVTDPARLAVPYADASPRPIIMPDPYFPPEGSGWTAGFSPNRIFNDKAFQSAGAGMAGTADDLMHFLETLYQGGGNILKPETVAAGLSNQIGGIDAEPGAKFGFFGSVISDPGLNGSALRKGAVQWGGVYGNSWFIDRENGLVMAALTNNALEGCMGAFPEDLRRAAYESA